MERNSSYREISKCRLCNSPDLKPFADFGSVPLGNDLQPSASLSLISTKYPLFINRCDDCGHFQLSVSVSPEKLYAYNYSYLTSIGKSFVNHLRSYASWACEELCLNSSSLVVDIGSNDGTCLSFFKDLGTQVVGVDPASVPAKIANDNGVPTINSFFDANVVQEICTRYGHADLITSHNALAHIDNLREVFANIHSLLKSNGDFIFEIGYFRSVLENSIFDTTYHEHLDYHHPLHWSICFFL